MTSGSFATSHAAWSVGVSIRTLCGTRSVRDHGTLQTSRLMQATLNVRDALSYLDQVKVQFTDHPDVYNRFLDIMKDVRIRCVAHPPV